MLWLRRLPWLPGGVIAVALWLWAYSRMDFAADAQHSIDDLWQSLGSGILATDPVGSIMALHIQPPLLNSLFAIDLQVTPGTHLFLATINLVAMVASIALLVDTLHRVDVGLWVAVGAGALYAVLPATVAYALWVYNVSLTGFFAIAAVWGVALAGSRATAGVVVSSLAVLGLIVTRSTFAFPVLLAWVIALVWLNWPRRSLGMLAGIGVVIAAGALTQLHYLVNFHQFTMSSWVGQNVLYATQKSGVLNVKAEARAALADNPCARAALEAFEEKRLDIWVPDGLLGLPECGSVAVPASRGVLAWDAQLKPGSREPNMNWRSSLAASRVWAEAAAEVVRGDPWQLARMAAAPPARVSDSGVRRYLSRSENYRWVLPTAQSLPFPTVGSAISTVFAPMAWFLMVSGWVIAAFSRRWRALSRPAFWFAAALLLFHISASTLLEYSEARRFRAEVEPVLMFAAVASAYCTARLVRSRFSSRTPPGT